jgi:hypothetical protein
METRMAENEDPTLGPLQGSEQELDPERVWGLALARIACTPGLPLERALKDAVRELLEVTVRIRIQAEEEKWPRSSNFRAAVVYTEIKFISAKPELTRQPVVIWKVREGREGRSN